MAKIKIVIVIEGEGGKFKVSMNDCLMDKFDNEFSARIYGKQVFDLHKKSAVIILKKDGQEKVLNKK